MKSLRTIKILRSIEPRLFKMDVSTGPAAKPGETKEKLNKKIVEGQAEVILSTSGVFYNPVQQFNRDLSVAVLSVFGKDYKDEKIEMLMKKRRGSSDALREPEFTILEALSATGLRSIRYAKEVPRVTKITANDLSEQAVITIRENVAHNKVENLIEVTRDDACMLMYRHKFPPKRFAVVDLDPYGCPSIFLDSAVQCVQDGGLLLVTATDMAVLAGNSPETCYAKYGAISLKTKSCHEMALRILLQCIEQHAIKYSRYIVPMLSISADFYIRVFVKIYSGAIHCKKSTSKLSMVYQCTGCDQITLQPLGGFKPNPTGANPHQLKTYLPAAPPIGANCEHCNQKHHLGGPIWSAPIHNEDFVTAILSYVQVNRDLFETRSRIIGVLSMIREELFDVPLYYTSDKMFGAAHLTVMPMLMLRSAILNAGYKVSYSHAAKNSIKTTAPPSLMWDIIRSWAQQNPVKTSRAESDPVTKYLLSQPIKHEIDFSQRSDANPVSRKEHFLRFQDNPTPYWGPGSKATAMVQDENQVPKKILNQNKRSKGKGNKRRHSLETAVSSKIMANEGTE